MFRDKVVLITGASSGIGRALAAAFARQGAQLSLVARRPTPGEHFAIQADVRKVEDVERAVASTLERFGRIDVLVNNAGIGHCGSVEETSLDEFREVFDTNFFGAFHFTRLVGRHMIERRAGLIIQISSLNGFTAAPMFSAYCASKFALEGMSQSARIELAKHNVSVMIARPGPTATAFFDHAKHFRERNPFRLPQPMDAAAVADKILRAAASGRREIVLTAEGKAMWWLKKFAPRLLDRLIMQHAT